MRRAVSRLSSSNTADGHGLRPVKGSRRHLASTAGGRVFFAASFLLVGAVAASGQAGQTGILSLPEVDLAAYDPDIRALIESGVDRVEALQQDAPADTGSLALAYGELGRAALYYALPGLAEAGLRNAAALQPEDFTWFYYLGVHYQNERELPRARAAFERALALRPADHTTIIRLGQVLLLLDDPRAETFFERAKTAEPWAAAAFYGLGRTARQKDDLDLAIEYFEAALGRQSDSMEIRQQLGLAYRDAGRLERAREHLASVGGRVLTFEDPLVESLQTDFSNSSVYRGLKAVESGRFERAAEYYREAVAGDPSNPVYRKALGGVLSTLGDHDGAVEQLEEAVRLQPDRALNRVSLAMALAERDGLTAVVKEQLRVAQELAPGLREVRLGPAEALVRVGLLEEAKAELESVLQGDPEDTEARRLLAALLLRQGDGETAIRHLEFVLEREPEEPQTLLGYGRALTSLGQDERAAQALKQVLEVAIESGQRALAHFELAQVLDRLGESDLALLHYRRGAALRPGYRPAQFALGLALAESSRHEEAAEIYAAILEQEPGDMEARRERALSLAEAGQLSQAIEELEAVLETPEPLDGGDPLGLTLAVLLLRDGRDADAEALLRRLIDGTPEQKDAHFNLAVVLSRRGQLDESARHLRQVLALDPADAQAHLLLAQLLARMQRFAEMRTTLEGAHRELPENLSISRALVQLLIGSPDRSVRDADTALGLALTLYGQQPAAEHSALVAAALAASARLNEAVSWQKRAVDEAEKARFPPRQLDLMRQDLARYHHQSGGGGF